MIYYCPKCDDEIETEQVPKKYKTLDTKSWIPIFVCDDCYYVHWRAAIIQCVRDDGIEI